MAAPGTTPGDYSVPLSVAFTADEIEQTVTVVAVVDDADEDGESVTLAFGEPLPRGVMVGSQAQTIVTLADNNMDDDDQPTVAALTLTPASISEDGTENSTVTATLDRASSAQIVVTVATASAYTLSTPRTLTFMAGETTSPDRVTLTAVDNDIDADDAMVRVGGTTSLSGLTVNAADADDPG